MKHSTNERLQRWRADEHKKLLNRSESTALGIVRGMEYLHENNIVFRDLKPRNIGYSESTGVASQDI